MKPSELTIVVIDALGRREYVLPSKKKFKKICKRYGMPHKKTVRVVKRVSGLETHTVMFDVPKYLAGLKKHN